MKIELAKGSVDMAALDDSVGLLLRLGQIADFDNFFKVAGHLGLRPGELSVLILIGQNPKIRQAQVCRSLMIKRANLTKMVRRFAAEGLVECSVPAADRRSVEMTLTKTGATRMSTVLNLFPEVEKRTTANLTSDEVASLKKLLRKLIGLRAPGRA